MAKATYWQRGETLDYKNNTSATIEANTIIVIGKRIGVIGTTIYPGEKGSLHVSGIYSIPKTADVEIALGANVYFDGTAITTTETDTPAGYAVEAAAADAATVLVKLLG